MCLCFYVYHLQKNNNTWTCLIHSNSQTTCWNNCGFVFTNVAKMNYSVFEILFWSVSNMGLRLVWVLKSSALPRLPPGDPLQWVPEDPSVQFGHVTVWGLLPERGSGGRGPLPAPQRCDRDQAAQQHVHVQSQSGHEAHLPGLQVHTHTHTRAQVWTHADKFSCFDLMFPFYSHII